MNLTTLIQTYPKPSIIVIALLVALFISVINYFILDKDRMREIKKRQKELQEEMKLHKENPEKFKALYKEMMSHSMESMKHSFKPMIITTIPILIVFTFIRGVYVETTLAGSWIWWYIGASIIASLIFRKLFKLP